MSKTKNSPDNLNAISTFVCVGESASLTAAAQKLQLSVSGVSKAISRLEERLHVRLFYRTTRSISLTEEGVAYFRRCKQILLDLEEAEAVIADVQSQPRGRLRIQLPRALGKKIVVPALVEFSERYTEIAVDVVLDGRSLNLEEEGIDIALRYGVPPDSPLIARRLSSVCYVACASPDYILRYGAPQTPEEIRAHRCVNYVIAQEGRHRQWHFIKDGVITSLDVSSVINVNDMMAVADAAANGGGIAYLTDFMAADYITSGALRVLLPSYIFEGEAICMVHPRRRYLSPRVRVLRDFLREILPATPRWQHVVLEQKRIAELDSGLISRTRR